MIDADLIEDLPAEDSFQQTADYGNYKTKEERAGRIRDSLEFHYGAGFRGLEVHLSTSVCHGLRLYSFKMTYESVER